MHAVLKTRGEKNKSCEKYLLIANPQQKPPHKVHVFAVLLDVFALHSNKCRYFQLQQGSQLELLLLLTRVKPSIT